MTIESTPTKPACNSIGEPNIDELGERIIAYAGKLSAATCHWLLLIAEFDGRQAFVRFGFPSTAHWLSYSCGLAARTARDHVRVARALAAHERLAAEMTAGRLSYSHARAISRCAKPAEHQLVDHLIDVAEHGTVGHLETVVRGLRTVEDAENPGSRDEREYVRYAWNDDSTWRLSARLDPERGSLVAAAVKKVAQAEALSETDALVRLAEIGLAALNDREGEQPRRPRELRDDEHAAVVVHLQADQLPGAPPARIANGPGLPPHVVKRLLCAGRIRTVLRDGAGTVLDVGRSHRLVTERQYRALLIRHGGHCAYPGCSNTRDLHAHHRVHWIEGGRTDMDNLVLLCRPHHAAHHDGVYAIGTSGGANFTFTLADGTPVPTAPMPPGPEAKPDPSSVHREYPGVAAGAATTRWRGERLDRHYAVAVLAQHRYAERNNPAPSRRAAAASGKGGPD